MYVSAKTLWCHSDDRTMYLLYCRVIYCSWHDDQVSFASVHCGCTRNQHSSCNYIFHRLKQSPHGRCDWTLFPIMNSAAAAVNMQCGSMVNNSLGEINIERGPSKKSIILYQFHYNFSSCSASVECMKKCPFVFSSSRQNDMGRPTWKSTPTPHPSLHLKIM